MNHFALCSHIPDDIINTCHNNDNFINVADDFIQENNALFSSVKMNWVELGKIYNGLAYHGITIIDNEMAKEIKKLLVSDCTDSFDKDKLIKVIEEALKRKCYLIHFGV